MEDIIVPEVNHGKKTQAEEEVNEEANQKMKEKQLYKSKKIMRNEQ